jgi:glyoxylase-like metal-dependent hydrolase (beta-lactamase superfamily II)
MMTDMNNREFAVHPLRVGLSCAYLIRAGDTLTLVDAGSPRDGKKILRRVEEFEGALRLIFITHAHFDHYGSAAFLREETGAQVAIHRADASAMARGETPLGSVRGRGRVAKVFLPLLERFADVPRIEADREFEDGDSLEEFGLNGEVIHLPGHTAGSSGLFLKPGSAFVGDLLSTVGGAHAQRYYADDWDQVGESVERLKSLNPSWTYTGHGCQPMSAAELSAVKVEK